MNLVILTGRLTKDPENRMTTGADPTAVSSFSLAVDRNGKGADFIRCTCFGKTAEFVEKYLAKGKKVGIEGRWQTGSYEKNGQRVYTNDCIVDRIEFLESKSAEKSVPEAGDFMAIPDNLEDEIPFN